MASTRDSGSDARERDLERKVDRLVPSARSPAGVAANGEGRDPVRGVTGLEAKQPPAAGIVATSEAIVTAVT